MVREGENPRRELAACWSVEVINGGRGLLFCSVSLISVTAQFPFSPSLIILCASASSFGSSEQTKSNSPLSFLSLAIMTKTSPA